MGKHKYTIEEITEWRREHGEGFIYCNPDDSNIIVPKWSGIGYTLNFANPFSFVIMALILGAIVAFIVLIRYFH